MNIFVIFLLGFISSQKINIPSEVFIGEIFCAAVLLFNIRAIRLPSGGKSILRLLLLWFVAQLTADIVNQTEFIIAMKGILVPVFVAIILLGLTTAFHKHYSKMPFYLFGVFVGMWISRAIGSEYYAFNPWKWGLGSCVGLCFFTWVEFYCKRIREVYILGATAIFVIICMMNSSRTMAAVMLTASTIYVLSSRIQVMSLYQHLCKSPWGVIQFFVVIILSVLVLDMSMVELFSYGPFLELLPPLDAMKFSNHADSKWGFILGGRSEILVSLEAFFDSPILGHGSWAKNSYYTFAHLDRVDAAGGMLYSLDVAESNVKSFLIPTHSYLMGAVVWGGVFAGFFWIRVLGILLSGFLNEKIISSPLLIYISISFIWSILFSPFGADARWLSTVLLFVYFSLTKISFQKKM